RGLETLEVPAAKRNRGRTASGALRRSRQLELKRRSNCGYTLFGPGPRGLSTRCRCAGTRRFQKMRHAAAARSDSAPAARGVRIITLQKKEGTTASRALRCSTQLSSSGDQTATTLCLALPWTEPTL